MMKWRLLAFILTQLSDSLHQRLWDGLTFNHTKDERLHDLVNMIIWFLNDHVNEIMIILLSNFMLNFNLLEATT